MPVIYAVTFIVWSAACANYLDTGNILALYVTLRIPLA